MVTFSKKKRGNIPCDGYKIFLVIKGGKSQLKENVENILGSNLVENHGCSRFHVLCLTSSSKEIDQMRPSLSCKRVKKFRIQI